MLNELVSHQPLPPRPPDFILLGFEELLKTITDEQLDILAMSIHYKDEFDLLYLITNEAVKRLSKSKTA